MGVLRYEKFYTRYGDCGTGSIIAVVWMFGKERTGNGIYTVNG